MSIRTPERTQFLSDLLTGAVEGGINYWAQVAAYEWSDEDPSTTYAVIFDAEDSDAKFKLDALNAELGRKPSVSEAVEKGALHKVTIESIATGLNKLINDEAGVHKSYVDRIAGASRRNDAGELDAYDCDMIFQTAIFGKAIYG